MNKFDEFIRRDDVWFQAAVAAGILFFGTVLIGTLIAFLGGGDADEVHIAARVDIVYKLALIGAGLITFCTVAWRGLLATQQVEAQRQQIEKLSSQIALTEESNLASLLQKGAELLADEKPGYGNAAVATLQAVITAPNPKFSVEAMNLLADFIQDNHSQSHASFLFRAAVAALLAGSRLGRRADRTLAFKFPANKNVGFDADWVPVFGVKGVVYEGGRADPDDFKGDVGKKPHWQFVKCEIYGGTVGKIDLSYSRCLFESCKIEGVVKALYSKHEFKNCNFSDAEFDGEYNLGDLREQGNYFVEGHEPTALGPISWLDHLRCLTEEEASIPF